MHPSALKEKSCTLGRLEEEGPGQTIISGSQLPAWSRLWCQMRVGLTLKPLAYSFL